MARRVGTDGRVLAVDIQPEMLAIVEERAGTENLANIDTILASATDPRLPASTVDLALLVHARFLVFLVSAGR